MCKRGDVAEFCPKKILCKYYVFGDRNRFLDKIIYGWNDCAKYLTSLS